MKRYELIITTTLILLINPTFSQESHIKGKIINYETNNAVPGVMIYEAENTGNGTVSDDYGAFEIKLQGNTGELHFNYLSFYAIKFLNIPIRINKNIDFGEIKLVSNHLMDNMTIGGPAFKSTEKQKEEDKRLRQNVLKEYKIEILGEKLIPYFEGKYQVFNFNKKESR